MPTSIDPCALVTAEEASKLAGVTFGAGQEQTTSGNGRICHYGATGNDFNVIVGVAPDTATAQAEEKAAIADLQNNAAKLAGQGLNVTQLPNFAPGVDAALLDLKLSVLGKTLGGTAIYLLKGTTFAGFSDISVQAAPPSTDAIKAQAMTVIGRLP